MSSSLKGDIITARSGGTHGYFPDFQQIETGFVAWGAGISSGKEVPKMGLEDIAPLVSELLDLNFKAKNGILFSGILKDVN
jgi:hypothetical protein